MSADTVPAKAVEAARKLEKQELPYSNAPEDLQDCSGIFHRILNDLRSSCESFTGPDTKSHRSSRGIAGWFASEDRLILVKDALDQDDLLQPGMVLFYGEQNKTYGSLSQVETLQKVSHLGIVVSVERDQNKQVQHYKLFHGRRTGRLASVTYHGRAPRDKKQPPLGNGGQQWIAAVSLCEQGTCACSP